MSPGMGSKILGKIRVNPEDIRLGKEFKSYLC